jgi:ribosomal protein S18 acetylase RimI-like enzyme
MSTTVSAARSVIQVDDALWGRASLRRLDWDSDFFGGAFGVIDAVEAGETGRDRADGVAALLAALLDEARADGYDHLIYRAGGDDAAAVHGAERAGLRLVDVGVDFAYRFDHQVRRAVTQPPGVRPAAEGDLPALQDMAGTVFTYSRFLADPHFSGAQVEAFHRQWITNLCNGLAQTVLVLDAGGAVAGFVSCAVDGGDGRIPLIATSAAHRRRGVGRALIDGALAWFRSSGATRVYVKTQAANVPAINLYERAGFVLDRCELTLGISLSNPAEHGGLL